MSEERNKFIEIVRVQNGFVVSSSGNSGGNHSLEWAFQSATALADFIEEWAVGFEPEQESKSNINSGEVTFIS